jgi:hypothetical protein
MRRHLGVGKPEGRAHARHAIGLGPHPACDDLRIGEDLGQIVDRPGRNAMAPRRRPEGRLAPLQRRPGQARVISSRFAIRSALVRYSGACAMSSSPSKAQSR